MKTSALAVMSTLLLALTGPVHSETPKKSAAPKAAPKMSLKIAAFPSGGEIPVQFTCDGKDVSPAIAWKNVPAGTKSLALFVGDPYAPGKIYLHWTIFNIPTTATGLPENVARSPELETGARQGNNDFGKLGYAGPCPAAGAPHNYDFKLYALDAKLELKPGAAKYEFLEAIKGRILAEAQFSGKYKRQEKK